VPPREPLHAASGRLVVFEQFGFFDGVMVPVPPFRGPKGVFGLSYNPPTADYAINAKSANPEFVFNDADKIYPPKDADKYWAFESDLYNKKIPLIGKFLYFSVRPPVGPLSAPESNCANCGGTWASPSKSAPASTTRRPARACAGNSIGTRSRTSSHGGPLPPDTSRARRFISPAWKRWYGRKADRNPDSMAGDRQRSEDPKAVSTLSNRSTKPASAAAKGNSCLPV
jgi:hypothetical protein